MRRLVRRKISSACNCPSGTGVPPVQFRWVAQASGLSLRASRPQPSGDVDKPWFARSNASGCARTKFGGTPEFDLPCRARARRAGATPVPPNPGLRPQCPCLRSSRYTLEGVCGLTNGAKRRGVRWQSGSGDTAFERTERVMKSNSLARAKAVSAPFPASHRSPRRWRAGDALLGWSSS
jgi:hypothetical protein